MNLPKVVIWGNTARIICGSTKCRGMTRTFVFSENTLKGSVWVCQACRGQTTLGGHTHERKSV